MQLTILYTCLSWCSLWWRNW